MAFLASIVSMINRYGKGANAERELIKTLYSQGFSVVRAAGSGVTPLPSPDIVALSKEKKIAFECKAWNSAYLNLPSGQILSTVDWCKIAGIDFYVAWKIPNKGWLFLLPEHFSKGEKYHSISLKKAKIKALNMEKILGKQHSLVE